jgi:hypothetical protein
VREPLFPMLRVHLEIFAGSLKVYIHKYHSRFVPEGLAKASQLFLQDTSIKLKLLSYEKYCKVTGGKPIAV